MQPAAIILVRPFATASSKPADDAFHFRLERRPRIRLHVLQDLPQKLLDRAILPPGGRFDRGILACLPRDKIKANARRTVALLVSDASGYAQVVLECAANLIIRASLVDELEGAVPGVLDLREKHLFFINAPT